MIDLDVVKLDSTPPEDRCPAHDGAVDGRAGNRLTMWVKAVVKRRVYRALSGRPRDQATVLPEDPRCVLVATGGNLGGAIISLPLIGGVRKRWPNCHLAIVSNRQHGLDIVRRAGVGDSYHLAPEQNVRSLVFTRSYWQFRREMDAIDPEVFIGNHDFGLAYTLPLRRIAHTLGHSGTTPNGASLEEISVIYDYRIPCHTGENWLRSYWNLLSAIGSDARDRPHIGVTSAQQASLHPTLRALGFNPRNPPVGIQSGVWLPQAFKAYPTHLMAECIRLLWVEHGVPAMLIGSAGQVDLGDYLAANYSGIPWLNAVGAFEVGELATAVSLCRAVVANDSGLMHLAAAVGTPVLAIYGMTDPAVTWVYGNNPKCRVIRRARCLPCYSRIPGRPETCPTRDCLVNIASETVVSELVCMCVLSNRDRSNKDAPC